VKTVWQGRALQVAAKYGEQAPMATVCCNACRTCTTTNILNLAAVIGGVAAAPFVRTLRLVRGRFI
jgi:hypothetical protein